MILGLPNTELLQESTEAVAHKILESSLENIFARVYFLIKNALTNLLKKNRQHRFFPLNFLLQFTSTPI